MRLNPLQGTTRLVDKLHGATPNPLLKKEQGNVFLKNPDIFTLYRLLEVGQAVYYAKN